jgi:putative endonuclease
VTDRQAIGRAAERRAEQWLQRAGLRTVSRNYRCRGGEIDLVMRDDEVLVFVEVRFRRHAAFGGALASVDERKRRRLAVAAAHYLQHERWQGPCRFDVVGLDAFSQRPDWIRDAFSL